jgi:Uma2 family endonuclease
MSVSLSPQRKLSTEEYLESEEVSEVRREHLAGWVYVMAGASHEHNTIALNVASTIKPHVRGGPCRVFISDMKVRVEATHVFYYSDVVVTCDPKDNERYFKARPTIIIEVTSPSTTVTDHREKLLAYQTLPSLREYVVIAQDRVAIEIFSRQQGAWIKTEVDPNGAVRLESSGLEISVGEIYEGVVFRSRPVEEEEY